MSDHQEPAVTSYRAIVDDLRRPDGRLYAVDIGANAALGWFLFFAAANAATVSSALLLALVAALPLYRSLAFIHDLFHQSSLRAVRGLWHLVSGVPLLLPLLLYLPIHQAHHNSRVYGTSMDGEYEQFAGRLWSMLVRLLLLNLLLPLALVVRFALLAPLGAVIPVVRREVIPAFVHLSLRMPFKAPPLPASAVRESRVWEALCAVFAWLLVGALFTGYADVVALWAFVLVVVATLNTIRAACSTHLYVEMPQGRDAQGQLEDSLNIGGNSWLTPLLCPAGLRYHALHHIAPYLPYHALGEAHRRIMRVAPEGSAYRTATVDGLREGWSRLAAATAPGSTAVGSAGRAPR